MKPKLVKKNILIFYINVLSNYLNSIISKLNLLFREMKIHASENYIKDRMTESAKSLSQYFTQLKEKRQKVIFKQLRS